MKTKFIFVFYFSFSSVFNKYILFICLYVYCVYVYFNSFTCITSRCSICCCCFFAGNVCSAELFLYNRDLGDKWHLSIHFFMANISIFFKDNIFHLFVLWNFRIHRLVRICIKSDINRDDIRYNILSSVFCCCFYNKILCYFKIVIH